jgi:cation diffusion facilitator CzcD-associated flavoprotein CzcO
VGESLSRVWLAKVLDEAAYLMIHCVACDIPAYTYQYSWKPNPRWSKFYAPGPEILQYLKDVADKHALRKFVRFNHCVVGATWHEDTSSWHLEVEAKSENGRMTRFLDSCNSFVHGVGVLNNWKWPDIEGPYSFKGELIHTAAYNAEADLTGRKVAVIGNSAYAV